MLYIYTPLILTVTQVLILIQLGSKKWPAITDYIVNARVFMWSAHML